MANKLIDVIKKVVYWKKFFLEVIVVLINPSLGPNFRLLKNVADKNIEFKSVGGKKVAGKHSKFSNEIETTDSETSDSETSEKIFGENGVLFFRGGFNNKDEQKELKKVVNNLQKENEKDTSFKSQVLKNRFYILFPLVGLGTCYFLSSEDRRIYLIKISQQTYSAILQRINNMSSGSIIDQDWKRVLELAISYSSSSNLKSPPEIARNIKEFFPQIKKDILQKKYNALEKVLKNPNLTNNQRLKLHAKKDMLVQELKQLERIGKFKEEKLLQNVIKRNAELTKELQKKELLEGKKVIRTRYNPPQVQPGKMENNVVRAGNKTLELWELNPILLYQIFKDIV